MTTLEEFYYGNIIPHEIPIIKGSEYDTANRLVVRHDEALTATQAEQKKNAEKCGDLWVNSDRLFINRRGEPMRPYYPYKWLKDFCEREGVPFKGLHSFRHTVATQSIVNGADVSTVSALLGHSSVSTTLNIYTHAVRKAKAKAANLMAGLIEENDP